MNTSAISNQAVASSVSSAEFNKTEDVKKTKVSGKTYGDPKLSDKAAKYYESLKKKFGNLDFVLVSKDKKDEAQSMAGKFANPNKTVVLIDDEKIERMANDKEYAAKYEAIIKNASANLSQMKTQMSGNPAVTSYGFKVNDNGTASYFAVIDKSLIAQKERIEKNAEKKLEAKKAANKEKAKEAQNNRLEKEKGTNTDNKYSSESDKITITANSLDELMKKINDVYMESLSDKVVTEDELKLGQHFDMNA